VCSYGLLGPGTEVKDRTAGAVRPLGFADGPTVKDEEVGDEGPFVPGNESAELLLDLVLFFTLRQSEPVGHPGDVSVHRDSLTEAEDISQHDVGRLAPDARQADELLHRSRHLTSVLLDQHLAAADDAFGLVSVEAGGADRLLQLGRIGVREIVRGAVLLEQVFRDLIDALVGALRGQDGGDQELKWVLEVERHAGVGVGLLKDGEDFLALSLRAPERCVAI